jgi:endonuclease YncB( thermonuclease family)
MPAWHSISEGQYQVRIRLAHLNRAIIIVALALGFSGSALATDLSGKVTEVIDGNTISLKSLSHTIKIRLLAVVPPDKGQPYADVARKHLADLILDKYVVVRYTGIGSQGYLVGRVLLEQADINAQMLRDGVAWYYKSDESDLSEADRQVYPGCEQAARAEKRGLWQDTEPLSPWEFRRREEARTYVSVVPKQTADRPTPTMGNGIATVGMLRSFAGPAMPISRIAGNPEANQNANAEWFKLKLKGLYGTVQAPTNGVKNSARMPLADGQMADFEWYMVRWGKTAYIVMSAIGPYVYTFKEVDPESNVLNGTVEGFVAGIRSDYQAHGFNFSCTATATHELDVRGGYHAREYSLAGCTTPGTIRVYTTNDYRPPAGHIREVHLVAAFSLDGKEDLNVKKFLQSVKLVPEELPRDWRYK